LVHHQLEDNLDRTFVLTRDIIAPTIVEIVAVEAEVNDKALTKAIEVVRSTVQLRGNYLTRKR
jgi:hypothetical protein